MSSTNTASAQITAWYQGPSATPKDIASDSYTRAVEYFEKELADSRDDLTWIRSQTSFQDVCDAVTVARGAYDKDREKHAGARKNLDAIAATLLNYSKVLDVITAVEPLYAGVAWGAIKFIVCGVCQHAKQLAELTGALTTIGDALPRLEISSLLYNTAPMQQAVAKTYAHVLQFLQRALSWYTSSSASRVIRSVFKPLTFNDIVVEIQRCVTNVGLVSVAAQGAEIRGQTHTLGRIDGQVVQIASETSQIPEMRAEIMQVLQEIINNRDLLNSIKVDTSDTRTKVTDSQLSKVIENLEPPRLPEDLLEDCKSLMTGRSPWTQHGNDSTAVLAAITQWIADPNASSLAVRAAPTATMRLRDLALSVLQTLATSGESVMWFFSYGLKDVENLSPTRILKSLLFQALRHDPSIPTRDASLGSPLTYQKAQTLDQWISLLTAALIAMNSPFLVIEADMLQQAPGAAPGVLVELHQALETVFENISQKGVVIKLLVVTSAPSLHPFKPSAGTHRDVILSAPLPAARRLPGRSHATTFSSSLVGK
jgi:hypothetical protein